MESTGNPTIDNAVIINREAGNSIMYKSEKFDAFLVAAQSDQHVEYVENEIRKLYGNDIGITTAKAVLKTIREFTAGFSLFILSIAFVALLVGAVGIITTLYTSVTERVKKIGTLKAIGAQNSTISRYL